MKCKVLAAFLLTTFSVLAVHAQTNEVKLIEDLKWDDTGFAKDEFSKIDDAGIDGVKVGKYKNKDRTKDLLVEIGTSQNLDIIPGYRIRIAVEVEDKEKNTYLVSFVANQPEGQPTEYTGQDFWELYMPEGELERPKVTAYAVQYGIMDGDTFLLIDENNKRVKSMDELIERTQTPFPGSVKLKYYYMYEDPSIGVTQSVRRTLKPVKK